MGSKWRKAKQALGCILIPRTLEGSSSPSPPADSVSLPSSLSPVEGVRLTLPMTPTPSSSGLRLSKHGTKSSKKLCAICLNTMGPGHAIFTAECSHSFHFNCITSNVSHGNRICPVCRAKWKEIPFQSRAAGSPLRKPRVNSVDDAMAVGFRQLHSPRSDTHQNSRATLHGPEPSFYDDDEELMQEPHQSNAAAASDQQSPNKSSFRTLEIKSYPEVPAISNSKSYNNFPVLIHLQAPLTSRSDDSEPNNPKSPSGPPNPRAPVDLVTILDVSGSMAGTKLVLLKRAMGFVIQNLGPRDRLSVIAFSSSACRLFPLRRMTDTGRHQALQAVNSLTSNGGTNIAEGLKRGARVMIERKWKNPVSSIILLSDGQDTYTVTSPSRARLRKGYGSLIPASIHGFQIPVHTFGFGADHDAASMHAISETSRGTFSFIEAEGVIQDAFAQCMGGLLSVVVQELQVEVECVFPGLQFSSIKSGSYRNHLSADARTGHIHVGDLYAEEERDFLVMVNVPTADNFANEMPLFEVRFSYRDPITKEVTTHDKASVVNICRPPMIIGQPVVSVEVDRQRNRLNAAEAMSEARAAAERGNLPGAVSVLEDCRKALSETVSAQAGDRLCIALAAELMGMQERMANQRVYEASGRAYVLSGLSSHSSQRATARGDSTDSTSLVQAYQTSSMLDMVTRSQTIMFGGSSHRPSERPPRSSHGRAKPR
ncbi:hypothetical protein Nepgr_014374 [Nepenthes gracilis]|uniref:Uncharacterized protein n=1 Tax=Nepenthes gracilis TaxID=150966 RepID=A0AAD3SJW5_NEPGR|nr:hypothetical protein Nepgr_014374 [Nepenthes gracilis]